MNHPCKTATLIAFAALLSAGPAFTQTPSPEATPEASAAPVAYVYVQTTNGVNLYDAAANGKLSLVKGSPFKTVGQMVGSNGSYIVTVDPGDSDSYEVHSYAVEPNGAIGKQVSAADTLDYPGSEGGIQDPLGGPWGIAGAALDHTGQNLYVSLVNADCASYQTFNVAKDSGELTFSGHAVGSRNEWWGPPAITAGDKFAYDPNFEGVRFPALSAFVRESDGTLKSWAITVKGPAPSIKSWEFLPNLVAADRTNHLATFGLWSSPPEDGYVCPCGPYQFVSYTMDDKGNLFSTDREKAVALPGGVVAATSLRMSPSGKILAVIGGDREGFPVGLFLMHFNGADPITAFSGLLSTDFSWSASWDNNDHLYALGGNRLRVYTITPTSIAQASGSPYTIPDLDYYATPYGLIVLPAP